MKTPIKNFILSGLLIFSFSMTHCQFWAGENVKGNGQQTTKTVNTPPYDKVKANGPIDLYLKKGKEGNISVTTDDNLHQYLSVEVKNETLNIRVRKGISIRRYKGFEVTIPFEDISGVSLSGSVSIMTQDPIHGEQFEASISGSGDINLALETNKAGVRVNGSGDVVLAGNTNSLEININGSGDFEGFGLNSEKTKIRISGSGDAEVIANAALDARVSGSGDIDYKGNPAKLDIKVSGSGSISKD